MKSKKPDKIKNRDRISEAIHFTTNKHKDQPRKDKVGTPYIVHPVAVMSLLTSIGGITDTDTLVAAVLHDTIEDTGTKGQEIEDAFGIDVLAYVIECTDDKSLPKQKRKKLQILNAPHKSTAAKLIKIADKISNVADLISNKPKGWSVKRVNRYLDWAVAVVAGLRGINQPLDDLFDQTVARARAKYHTPQKG